MNEITINDFKDIHTCGWTADNDLLTFFIKNHDGTIKTLDFTKLTYALKLQKVLQKQLEEDNEFMYAKDGKLEGIHTVMVRRGILQLLVDKAQW